MFGFVRQWVLPSFILAIRASGSVGFSIPYWSPSSCACGPSAPVARAWGSHAAFANSFGSPRIFGRFPPHQRSQRRVGFQRGRIDGNRLPLHQPFFGQDLQPPANIALCISSQYNRRVREMLE